VPVRVRGRELHAGTVDLCSSTTFWGQVDGEAVSEAWWHGRVAQPDLTVESHVKIGVQAHSGEFDLVANLLGCAEMEDLKTEP